ncbi:carboxypeptidase-like regulatory domain-containing protein, partial [Rhizobium leguminosarum]|uniref:carboxypeptidase-like regulatory domain-containing protein n=1 Tax=Rhizobium leguminosarum TaxID=384 RepID=UPI003F9C0E09
YLPKKTVRLLFAAILCGVCIFSPDIVLAEKSPGENKIANPDQTITGTIKDASNGKVLGGATISVKGGNQQTTSDNKGAFSIVVLDNNAVLVISYVGF